MVVALRGDVSCFLSFFVALFLLGNASNESTTLGDDLSTKTREVCEMNNSCSTSIASTEKLTEKKMPEKWLNNVSNKTTENNETSDSNHSAYKVNSSTDAFNIEIDLLQPANNQSSSSNESKPVVVKYPIQMEENCFCDITRGGCDLNCCCDQDCRYVNRNVFQTCNKSSSVQTNNDMTCITKVLNSPFLCIVKDNLYSRHFYPHYKTSVEIFQVDSLMKNRQLFGWPTVLPFVEEHTNEEAEPSSEVYKEYKVDSPLLVKSDRGFRVFHLPKTTLTSRDCNQREPVRFLNNFETLCTHRLSTNLAAECESEGSIFNPNTYFRNISIVMNPALINDSFKLNCTRNCMNIVPFVCDTEDISTCEAKNTTFMTSRMSRNGRNVCKRAVTNVYYKILHNGTDGILAAQVFLLLQNLTFNAKALWAVRFKMQFEWFNQNETFEVSGYPGYIAGKPVITGFKVAITGLNQNLTRYTTRMHRLQERWLTVFATDVDGSCSKTRRRNVLFEHNIFAQCSIKTPKIETVQQCEQLQNKILNVIFGDYVNITNVIISKLGAPQVQESSNWIPLATNLGFAMELVNGTCSEFVTSVKLIILHSAVGDFDNPEQTIVAAKLSGTPVSRNLSNHDWLKITFAVNFYDITSPPLRIFAEPPTYEIKLPTDFFYPFFSSAYRLTILDDRLLTLTFLTVFLHLY